MTFQWVKGHSDNRLNNRCDALAGEATKDKKVYDMVMAIRDAVVKES